MTDEITFAANTEKLVAALREIADAPPEILDGLGLRSEVEPG
jgi:hypothetical protein